jgi:hypothetical protein
MRQQQQIAPPELWLAPRISNQMIQPKRSGEQRVSDDADLKAFNPLGSRQTISDSQAEPEFQENHNRLKADRLARDAKAR